MRAVAGRVNAPVGFVSVLVFALVACRRDDDHAEVGQFFDFTADRIIRISVHGDSAKTQIDNANIVGGSICQNPIQTVQKPCGSSVAAAVQNFNADNIGVRRYPFIRSAAYARIAGDQTCDVRSVSIGVSRIAQVGIGEIDVCQNARGRSVFETVMSGINS